MGAASFQTDTSIRLKCPLRTNFLAFPTSNTFSGIQWMVRLQNKIGDNLTNKNITSIFGVQDQPIFPPSAQTCVESCAHFSNGGIIGKRLKLVLWKNFLQSFTKTIEILSCNHVVIGHHRISRDISLFVLPCIIWKQAHQHRCCVLWNSLFCPALQTRQNLLKRTDSKWKRFLT